MLKRSFSVVVLTIIVASCSAIEEQTPAPGAQDSGIQQQNEPQEPESPSAAEEQGKEAIIGTWQSDEESSLTVRYGADGTVNVVSTAEGGMAFSGTWTVVDPATEDVGVAAEMLTGLTILRLNYPNATTVYIGIKSVTATTLETVEIASIGGKVAAFTRIQ